MRIFITGGASGIGRAVADRFLGQGFAVGVVDISADAVGDLKGRNAAVFAIAADAADPNAVQSAVDSFAEHVGGLDALVTCVGLAGPTQNAYDVPNEEWDAVMRTNIDSHFYAAKTAVSHLKKSSNASISILSSAGSRVPFPKRAPYGVSKTALNMLARILAHDLSEDKIRVNAILPGAVGNARMEAVIEARAAELKMSQAEMRDDITSKMPFGEFVGEEDIADLLEFLVSDKAKFITAQLIGIGEFF